MTQAVSPADPLPPLRRDLRLLPAAPEPGGAPMWTIHDPVRDRFFRIGSLARDLLSRWSAGRTDALLRLVERATAEDLTNLLRFLSANDLLETGGAASRAQRLERLGQTRKGWATRLLHGYLFIKIPLVRPDRLLDRALPHLRPLLSRRLAWTIGLMGLLGLVLVLRQWDHFLATLVDQFSLEGAGAFALALVGAKILHEVGHAVAAKALGCRVRSMGVALLVLWPVLYTDTTDAWRLTKRRQRLAIGAAGMVVELALACLATLAWALLPDGALRGAAFTLATVTWISSLAVNLNPFMRFDGYYILSDLLGVDNLQARSFALARWRGRKALLGFDDPPPEILGPRLRRVLTLHAFGTWIYRFFLFLGIALLVYHLFFKVLGIALMMVELVWFLGRPIWSEARVWWSRRDEARWTRGGVIALGLFLVLLALVLVPWRGEVTAPALLEAARVTEARPPLAARLLSIDVVEGERVEAGQTLARLEDPDAVHQRAALDAEIDGLRLRLDRVAADGDLLAAEPVLRQALAQAMARRDLLAEAAARLTIQAAHGGVIRDLAPGLRPGLWIRPDGTPLARVVSEDGGRVTAFLAARDIGRVAPGGRGRFLFDDPARAGLTVDLDEVDTGALTRLSDPALASANGGALSARRTAEGAWVPGEALYRAHLTVMDPGVVVARREWGRVTLSAERASLAGRFLRHALGVLVRESGF